MSPERRLLAMVRPVRGDLLAGILLAAATLAAGVALAATAAYLISRASLTTAFVDVALLIAAVRAFAMARAAFRYCERYVSHRAMLRILARLRAWAFAAIEPRAPFASGTTSSGDLLARLGADVDSIDGFYVRGLVPPLAAVIAGTIGVFLLGSIQPALGLTLAAGLVLGAAIVTPVAGRLAQPLAGTVVAERARLHAAITEELAGIAELVAFEASSGMGAAARDSARALRHLEGRQALIRGGSDAIGALVAAGTALAVVVVGAGFVAAGQVEGVMLAVLPLAALATFEGVALLPAALQERDSGRAAASRVFDLVDPPPAVPDPPSPSGLPTAQHIEVRDLGFRYRSDLPAVFDGWSVTIPAGGRAAVTGPSGSGKSTLVGLLVRFLEPDQGQILIGGVDVRTCRGEDVRSLVAVVPQHPYLFYGTIRDNLLVARGDATDTDLLAASRIAQIDDLLERLPTGLDTKVGQDGLHLSGGERQRLAIARMVLKDAPIVILDEATAHLDATTEVALVSALDQYLCDRTTVILSHRSRLLELAAARIELPGPGSIRSAG